MGTTELTMVSTYLSSDQIKSLDRLLKKQGVKRSEYIRSLILADLGIEYSGLRPGRPAKEPKADCDDTVYQNGSGK